MQSVLSVIAEPHRVCLGTRRLSNHERKMQFLFGTCLYLHSNYLYVCHDTEPFHIKEGLNLFPRSAMHMHYKLCSVSLRHRLHKMDVCATCPLFVLPLSV